MSHTDASKDGLGAILYQQQEGKMHVIAYASRTLSPAEKNCHLHSSKLELLARKWAVCDYFKDYLYHALSFVIYTDNNSLTYLQSTVELNSTTHRWVAEPADYNFSIKQWRGGRGAGGAPPPSDNFFWVLKSKGGAKIRNCQCEISYKICKVQLVNKFKVVVILAFL